MAITFKDVARLAGVSTQTVSRVTNGADNVAEKTRIRVNEAIKKLEYVPNKSAQLLSRSHSQIIGIISLHISLHGVAQIADGIRKKAHEVGYATTFTVITNNSLEEYRNAIREFISSRVDAIVINAPLSEAKAKILVEQFSQITFIFIDVPKGSKVNHISCDHKAGAKLAVLHLIEQDRENFICVTGPKASSGAMLRHQEWQRQLQKYQRNEVATYEGDWQAKSGYDAIMHALKKGFVFDAVLVGNDQMALGVLCALNEASVHVPKTVSVVGFDDTKDSQFFSPPLTTIKQDFILLGKKAVERLLEQIKNKGLHISEILSVKLVVRKSTEKKLASKYDKEEILKHLENIRVLLP